MTFKFNFHSHDVHFFAYYLSEPAEILGEYESDWLWERCDDIVAKTVKPKYKFNIKDHLYLEDKSKEPWANINKYFPKTDDYHPIYVQKYECFIEDKNNPERKTVIPDENYRDFVNFVPENKTATISPVKLYNTYGLCIQLNNLNPENSRFITNEDVVIANPDNCLILDENKENKFFIGQTLLITINLERKYYLKCKHNQDKLKRIADTYLELLLPKNFRKPPFNRSGKLFGSPIYQYGIIRAPKSYYHVLIWFVSDKNSANKIKNKYNQLLDLFLFRNRVIHAYNQIKEIEKSAKDKSKKLQIQIKESQKSQNRKFYLEKLQTLLQELPDFSVEYAENIRSLKEFQYLIVSHTRNYDDKLNEIKSTFSENEDFSFLEDFINRTCIPYQDRVNAAVNFFQLDINLVDNAIDSIRGQLAIKQAHRERQLQAIIAGVGFGVAGAGNLASSYEAAANIPENYDNSFYPSHFANSFILSSVGGILITIFTTALVYKILNILQLGGKPKQQK